MSIKGTKNELFVGKTEVNFMDFWGKKIATSYDEMKRIDYCYADKSHPGYMKFISKNNEVKIFGFSYKANDPISRTVAFIAQLYPNLQIKEFFWGEDINNRSVSVSATFGNKEIGLLSNQVTIDQDRDGYIYFNKNNATYYSLVGYEWGGPIYDTVTTVTSRTVNNSTTRKKGKALKVGAGAVVGSLLGPAGIAVGATMGLASKGKSKTAGDSITSGSQIEKTIEKASIATLTFRNLDNGKIYKLSFNCTSDIDAKLKCFSFETSPESISDSAVKSLDGIKALKELLDMGAITQAEFDSKKKQILGI